MEAFLYFRIDKHNDKMYLGVRKGNPNDRYVTSSKHLKQMIGDEPDRFYRVIVAFGKYDDLLGIETKMLKKVDAKNNPIYYNMHNGDGNFVLRKHSDKTKAKMSALALGKPSHLRKGIKAPKEPHGLIGTKQSNEHLEKRISKIRGIKRSEEFIKLVQEKSRAKIYKEFHCDVCNKTINDKRNFMRWHSKCKAIN